MIILSLILAIIGGALVGGGLVLADKVGFYLIVVMPIIGGAIIGTLAGLPYLGRRSAAASAPASIGSGLADVVVRDNRPAALPLVFVALIGALVASGVYWAGSYIVGTQDFIDAIILEDSSYTREEAAELIELYYEREYKATGFVGFVQELAALGLSINRARSSSSSGITLEGNMVYAYWGLELVLLAGFAIGSVLNRARGQTAPKPATAS